MIVLDAKTDFSFLRGFGTPQQWLARCKETGATIFGIADYCSTWAHKPFADAFKDSGVHLLFGVQVPVVGMLDKDPRFSLVTLIAKGLTDELYAAMTAANTQSYYRPRLTWAQVKALKDCVRIVNDVLPHHAGISAKCADYLGLSADMSAATRSVALPHVLAYGPRFPAPEQRRGYQVVSAVGANQRVGDGTDGHYMFRDFAETNALFGYNLDPKVIENTEISVSKCVATLPKASLMRIKGRDLRSMAIAGTQKFEHLLDQSTRKILYKKLLPGYQERLDYELAVIAEKKFEDYFYFVADLVKWARERMFVGPGRGSSGGSLVCYLLGITTVDPLKFGTMFERFIDITRNDWPDIDIDFPDTRREEVFEYLRTKYGSQNVARLGTITEFGGKSAINDTARAFGIPFDVAREIGKWTEGAGQGAAISPAWIYENVQEVQSHLLKYPDLRLACEIDGHARQHGVHPAGVVVTSEPISRFGTIDKNGVISLDMKSAEKMGLIKMDALGLRTLSVIQDCCDLAKIDANRLFTLDWEDKAIYERVFNADRVTGIFQFEGHAVRSLMKAIKVEAFNDLCAITSLARPGPLVGGAAENWVKSRNGELAARDLHPSLDSTYGHIVYQEQAMAIVRDIGKFDIVDVNGFRRAVGKKDPATLRGYRDKFIKEAPQYLAGYLTEEEMHEAMDRPGMEIAQEKAEALWDEMCEFASYAFNFSHAVAYCMISFMTAYLKLNHPLEFAVAHLRNAADDDQAKNLLRELAEEGYSYVPFDPHKSQATWAIIDGKLYGGFDSVRGIGIKTGEKLLAIRESFGLQEDRNWLDTLTEAQRKRLLTPFNTPWHSLTYFGEKFRSLYERPENYRCEGVPAGFRGPVLRIREVPEMKGNYAFLGKIKNKKIVDLNEPSRLAKRDGKVFDENTTFVNLFFEDDTGEIATTINRWKVPDFEWLLESETEGRDFFVRGNIINDGRRWMFIDNIVEIKGV